MTIETEALKREIEGLAIQPQSRRYTPELKARVLAWAKSRQAVGVSVPSMCLEIGISDPTLRRYLRDPEPGLQVVAPLDYPAEGVVLLTSDGELAQAMSKKSQRVVMTYHLKLQGVVGDDSITRLLKGWRWENRPVRPEVVAPLATTGKNTWIEMVVAETRPRALKAAGDLIRHSLLKISRVRLGGLSFEGLAMGGWRDLTKPEINDLRRRAGLDGT